MTNYTPEQLAASTKANVKAMEGFTTQAYSGFEKLVELNMAASKSMLAESFSQLQAVMGAKDPQEVMALQTAMAQPLAEKSVAYGRHVYAIATEAGADFTKAFEAKVAEAQGAFSSLVENMSKNAPAGSETFMAAFKSALQTSQNVIESAQSSAKKTVEMAESSFTTLANQAVSATTAASKKR